MATFPFRNKYLSVTYSSSAEKSSLPTFNTQTRQGMLRPAGIFTQIHIDSVGSTNTQIRNIHTISSHGVISSPTPTSCNVWHMVTADCPGLVVLDLEHHTIGLLHLGWLQLYLNAPKKFLRVWRAQTPLSTDMRYYISPNICSNCFTLTGFKGWIRIVLFTMSPWRAFLKKNGKDYSIDLRSLLHHQLKLNGISSDTISHAPECTFEDNRVSSHRREGTLRRSSNVITVIRTMN